jgi:ZIP family zinc transporter
VRSYLVALGFALLPALGNFFGGVLAELFTVRERVLSYALHAAAGVVLAVVGIELMPPALATDAPWLPILAFVLGGGFFLLADHAIDMVSARFGGGAEASPWVIYFGVAMDLFSDGIMIGTGTVVASALGFVLALGQVPADIPEGFAAVASLKDTGLPRAKRLVLAGGFAIPIFVGVTIGYWLVRGRGELLQASLLAFTGGVLTTVVVEEIVPEAHREGGARLAALVMVGGFALFALVSAYVG